MSKLAVAFRPLRDRDWPFVCHSWSLTIAGKQFVPENHFKFKQEIGLLYSLRDRNADFVVAVDPDDDDHIFGWACAETPLLHFVYVKAAYRRQGIARRLMGQLGLDPEPIVFCTFWNHVAHYATRHKTPARIVPALPRPQRVEKPKKVKEKQ